MNGDFIRHRASTGIGIVAFSQNSKRLYPRARFLDGCPLSDSNWLYHSMWYLLSEWLEPSCPRGGWSYDTNQLLWPEVGWLYDRNQLVGPGIGWSYDINQLLWPEVGWLYDRNQLLWPGIGWSYDINQLLWPEVGCDRNQLLMSGIGCFFLFFFWSLRMSIACTYTHSPLGSFVPGILNNAQQIRQSVYSSYHQDRYRYLRCVFLIRLAL